MNRTSIGKVVRRRLAVAIVLMAIGRMVEIAVDAAEGPVAAGEIVDAAGAVEGWVAADGIVADAAGRAEEGTRIIATDLRGNERPRRESWSFIFPTRYF